MIAPQVPPAAASHFCRGYGGSVPIDLPPGAFYFRVLQHETAVGRVRDYHLLGARVFSTNTDGYVRLAQVPLNRAATPTADHLGAYPWWGRRSTAFSRPRVPR
jgi:hypothetical protein